jgi:hypothetical protein
MLAMLYGKFTTLSRSSATTAVRMLGCALGVVHCHHDAALCDPDGRSVMSASAASTTTSEEPAIDDDDEATRTPRSVSSTGQPSVMRTSEGDTSCAAASANDTRSDVHAPGWLGPVSSAAMSTRPKGHCCWNCGSEDALPSCMEDDVLLGHSHVTVSGVPSTAAAEALRKYPWAPAATVLNHS